MSSATQIVWLASGSPPVEGCSVVTGHCWMCAGTLTRGMPWEKWSGANFTDWNRIRCPRSPYICASCVYVCSWTDPPGRAGKNPDGKGTMFRMFSHVWEQGWQGVQAPEYGNANKGEKPFLRDFIAREHAGTWFAVVADGGKKHLLPWARINPPGRGGLVLLDDLEVRVPGDVSMVTDLCNLLTAGPSKSEIESGDYSQANWLRCMPAIRAFETEHGRLRGSAWFTLALWLAQRDEDATTARMAAEKEKRDAERERARAVKKPARRGDSVRAQSVPREPEPERAEALGDVARQPETSGADDGERRGMGDPVRERDARTRVVQGRLPGID